MMKSKLLLWAAFGGSIFLSSCSEKVDTTPTQTYIEVAVLDANSYSATNTSLSSVSGALVRLFLTKDDVSNNNPAYSNYTYTGGYVIIPVTYKSSYYLVVSKDTASNIYNNKLVAGVFQSQIEIQQSPVQTPAGTVGSVKYTDLNGDGKIDDNDNTVAQQINLSNGGTESVTSYIYK